LIPIGFSALLLGESAALGHVTSGANCVSCHSTARQGLSLTGFQSTTNLGAGTLKVYRVVPGQSVPIGITVSDGHNSYGLAMANLTTTGLNNATHQLSTTPDAAWTKRSGYYSRGPTSANQSWTFNLAVLATTPPDRYLLSLQMAGTGGGRWGQQERFYLEVVRPQAPQPTITEPTFEGSTFACRVATATGYTYRLEARDLSAATTWTTVAQVAGDGTTLTLRDPAATAAALIYRVRVE
jgi:hypothetical protein